MVTTRTEVRRVTAEATDKAKRAALDQAVTRALALHQRGRLREAHDAYRAVLAADSTHAEANHLLGLVLHQAGHSEAAAELLATAVANAPANPTYHVNRGVVLKALGQLEAAVASYEAALRLDPNLAVAQANLGVALLGLGRVAEAIAAQRAALALKPNYPEAEINLGLALGAAGDAAAAIAAFERGLKLQPDYFNAHIHLTNARIAAAQFEAAEAAARAAVRLQPQDPAGHHALGRVLAAAGQYGGAADHFRQALALRPDGRAFVDLGQALNGAGDSSGAVAAFRSALELGIADAEVHAGLGRAQAELGGMPRALDSYRRALELDPHNSAYRAALGPILIAVGLMDEADAIYRDWLARDPEALTPRRASVFTSNYLDGPASETSLRAREYGRRLAQIVPARTQHNNDRNPDRRLRVGLVSGDFNAHPVATFLAGMLEAVDPATLDLFAYSNSLKRDAMTERLNRRLVSWREVARLDDAALDALIVGDGIDILVDLAGYSGDSRLGLLARKPAPVAVTWLGYSGTTGLDAVDYILADRWVIPEVEAELYTETPWRLPDAYLCFTPPEGVGAVGPLPARRNGAVTFGSFNNLNKVTDRTLRLWGRVLDAVPGARLALKSTVLRRAGAPDELRARCRAAGIADEQLVLLPYQAAATDHLSAYGEIDIGLDPFPYNGTTTTCEALLMGVPVLTLRGDRFIAHVGESLLRTVGLEAWVAEDEDDFVARAAAMANDLTGLERLRGELRPRLLASPLCDGPRFARHFEGALRGMWQHWCAGAEP